MEKDLKKRSEVYANFVQWAAAEGFAKDKLPAIRAFAERVEESGTVRQHKTAKGRGFQFCRLPRPGGEDDFLPEEY